MEPAIYHEWLDAIQRGDENGANELFEYVFPKLVRKAREKLESLSRRPRVADEEDIALSAFASVERRLRNGELVLDF